MKAIIYFFLTLGVYFSQDQSVLQVAILLLQYDLII